MVVQDLAVISVRRPCIIFARNIANFLSGSTVQCVFQHIFLIDCLELSINRVNVLMHFADLKNVFVYISNKIAPLCFI